MDAVECLQQIELSPLPASVKTRMTNIGNQLLDFQFVRVDTGTLMLARKKRAGPQLRTDDRQLVFAPGFNYVSLDLRNLLGTEVRSSILSLIKSTPQPAEIDDD